jgi:hypothetical protein
MRALLSGAWTVLRSPVILLLVIVVTMAAAAPFAVVVGSRVQASLANRPPLPAAADGIDAEWWMQFRTHAEGIARTFAPVILGFAAPLSNISALLDGTPQPLALAGPLILTLLLWAFLWGGILDRYSSDEARGIGRFGRAAMRFAPRMLAIGIAAAIVNVVLYFTVHAVLFGPVYRAVAGSTADDSTAFAGRVILYVIFGLCLIVVSLIADYARIAVVAGDLRGAGATIRHAASFVRQHWSRTLSLYLMTGALFIAGFIAYGLVETYGGSRVGGWRAVAIGQGFVIGRLFIRLLFAASESRLYRMLAAS